MPAIGVVLAAAGFALMLTPLHFAGALVVVIGAGLAALAAPDYALLAILVLFPLHPLVSRSAALDFGVSGNSLIVFDAWKEVALAAILGGQVARILLGRSDTRTLRLHYVDLVAAALVVLVALGLAMNPGGLALNATRLWLFPVGVYVAVRLSALTLRQYIGAAAVVATGIGAFLVVQSNFLGSGFVSHYWGNATLAIPYTYTATSLIGVRGSGTLASPNEAALILAVWACVLAAGIFVLREWRTWLAVALGVVLVAVTVTFSRSGVLGVIGGLFLIGVAAGLSGAFTPRRGLALFLIAVIAGTSVSGLIYSQRGGVGLITGTVLSISGSGGGTDTEDPGSNPDVPDASTADHFKSLRTAAALVQAHPLGVGLGDVGARVVPLTGQKPKYIIESYYLTVGASVGWLGLLWSLLMPLAFGICALQALWHRQKLIGLSLLGTAAVVAFVGILLPTMAEPQIAMIPWAIAAFAVGASRLTGDEDKAEGPAGSQPAAA